MSINIAAIIQSKRVFDNPQVDLVHGSVFVDPYYIGTSRTGSTIVRIHKDDFSTYDVLSGGATMDAAVYVPNRWKIYTIGKVSTVWWLIEITPDPFSVVLVLDVTSAIVTQGSPIVTDGSHLYLVARNGSAGVLWKLDLNTLALTDSIDITSVVPNAHAMLFSEVDGLLYVASGSSAGVNAKVASYDPDNLVSGAIASVQIPGSTDDLGGSTNFIFGSHELTNPAIDGYTWGAYAVRKSDFAIFSLPKLDAADVLGTHGYFTGVINDRWLLILKTNRKLYAIDLVEHPPDTWSLSSDASQVVDIIATFQSADIVGWTDENGNLLIPAELAHIGNGRFLSFGWPQLPVGFGGNNRSGVIDYTLPLLSSLLAYQQQLKPERGDTFVTKEKDSTGNNIIKTIHSVIGQPLPSETGGIYLVFSHDIHRDIIPHETEDGTVAGHEQVRFAIKYNDVLARWEENNL